MKIHETLERDPRQFGLANSGQARIALDRSQQAEAALRAELETFVCDGQYADALRRVLERYLASIDRPRQDAVWVSGFFGSGKSHLLKMIGHLWADTAFADGATARGLVRGLPDDVRAHFVELDTKARRLGVPVKAALGTLPSGSGDSVRATVLSIILDACGLPTQVPQAEFVFWARERGFEKPLRDAVAAQGKEWYSELNALYSSPLLARTLLSLDPQFATSEASARETLRHQFPVLAGDIDKARFLRNIRSALGHGGKLPLVILALDEAQQYLGASDDRATVFTEAVEAVSTQLDSRVLLVASGQSSLNATKELTKLRDRFPIAIQLSDADVEAVTRKVLLAKRPSAVPAIETMLEQNAGEVSKHLRGAARLQPRPEDRATIVADYPLLPSRRRFWEECFRTLDAQGTKSQLRSQLTILHETLRRQAERSLGAVVPADALYDALAPNLIDTGVLPRGTAEIIARLGDGTPEGHLRRRLCAVVFLIGKLKRDEGLDTGVRATSTMLADLLVDDVTADSGPFRRRVDDTLTAMLADGVLMLVGTEYRIQTPEGAEWDAALKERTVAIASSASEIELRRSALFATALQQVVGQVKVRHGLSKVTRQLRLHVGSLPQGGAGTASGGMAGVEPLECLTVLARDQWSTSQQEVLADARRRGPDDALIHVFLPDRGGDQLKARIAEAEAARKVLEQKGVPTTDPGRQAREGMVARLRMAEEQLGELVREIVRASHVYQGGGGEVYGADLTEKLQSAASASLARLYPRFDEGDHGAWEVALKRAKDGADAPFQIVGWQGPTDQHPVCREVLAAIGTGAKGTAVRAALKAPPFGWSQDAIDAALIALHQHGAIRASRNHTPLPPRGLDQSSIPAAEFRLERVTVSTQDRLIARGLMSDVGLSVKSGEEDAKAPAYIDKLTELVQRAGGEPPLPERPASGVVDALRQLSGAELLAAIVTRKEEIERLVDRCKALGERVTRRLETWRRLERLAAHAASTPAAEAARREMDAIRTQRTLLDATDPTEPLLATLAAALRQALSTLHANHAAAHTVAMKALEADRSWTALPTEGRQQLVAAHGLTAPMSPAVGTDDELLAALDAKGLNARADAIAALPERVRQALADAARQSRPQARRVSVTPATLENEADVRTWLTAQERALLEALRDGPVIVG